MAVGASNFSSIACFEVVLARVAGFGGSSFSGADTFSVCGCDGLAGVGSGLLGDCALGGLMSLRNCPGHRAVSQSLPRQRINIPLLSLSITDFAAE